MNRCTRSFSFVCETDIRGELIVLSLAAFKIILSTFDGVRKFIEVKKEYKMAELTKILNEQSV